MGRRTAAQRPLSPDPGLYGPGSEAWRLNREAALLLGAGPRALLMQVAHPLVAAGVDQHSDFRADPWARLAGTIRSYLRIVYGTTPAARAEIRRLNRLHAAVMGPGYEARDPELALWVHATLVDSTLATVGAWVAPLSSARRAWFYAETLDVGRLFGIGDALLPPDIYAFDAYVAAMTSPDGPVHPSPTARDLASVILRPPLAPVVARGPVAARLGDAAAPVAAVLGLVPPDAVSWLLIPAVGLLPEGVRREYRLPWGARERAIALWLTSAWRGWRPLIPANVRVFPQALAADARMRARSDAAVEGLGELG